MEIVFTNHALYQINERKIDRILVEEVIKSPDVTKRVDNKYYVIKSINNKKLKVVYVKQRYIKVVTLYWI